MFWRPLFGVTFRKQPRPGQVRLGKLGQALCSAPFYETTAGRLSQEKDDTPTPPTPSPTTANPQPLERRLQRDWPVSEGTLPTPDSNWGQGLNLGGQETAESRESFSQGFGEVLGIFPEGQLCPTPAHWEGPWQGPDLGHTADSSEEGNSPFSLLESPRCWGVTQGHLARNPPNPSFLDYQPPSRAGKPPTDRVGQGSRAPGQLPRK